LPGTYLLPFPPSYESCGTLRFSSVSSQFHRPARSSGDGRFFFFPLPFFGPRESFFYPVVLNFFPLFPVSGSISRYAPHAEVPLPVVLRCRRPARPFPVCGSICPPQLLLRDAPCPPFCNSGLYRSDCPPSPVRLGFTLLHCLALSFKRKPSPPTG